MRQRKSEWAVSEMEVSYTPAKPDCLLPNEDNVVSLLYDIWDKEIMNLQESFYCLFLNLNNGLISWRCLSIGTSTQCLVDVKQLMTLALKCNASKIIIAHNHPSGSVKPSIADEEMTKTILSGCNLLDIVLVDHIILTNDKYYSFASNNRVITSQSRREYKITVTPKTKKK